MAGLKQKLKNKMDDDRSFATKVSKIAGYANPTGFYKFLNKDESEFKDIQKLIEIVQYAFPEDEFAIMDEYIRTLNPNNVLARQALEYAYVNKLNDLFVHLLDNLKNCKNAESNEWASVYQVDYNVSNGKITPIEAINILNTMIVKSPEMKVFIRIAKFYCYQDLKFIDMMFEMSAFIEFELKSIKNEFMLSMYGCRYGILISNVYLHTGEIGTLRKHVITHIDNVKCYTLAALLYHVYGISYLFENYDQSIKLLEKALQNAIKSKSDHWINEIKRSLNFVNNYWGKEPQYLNEFSNHISDIHEIAFYYASRDKNKSIEILDSMDLDKCDKLQKAYHFFYKGLATNNKNCFYDSIEHFNDVGEKFYKKIAIIELRKRGESERVLRIFEQ